MNSAPRCLPALFAGVLLGTAAAQTPENPPPWWRVNDNVTVSLYWSFDTPFAPGTFPAPTLAVVPPWYSPVVTHGSITGNLVYVPTLAGNVGVLGLTGSGAPQSAGLNLNVDNDPYPDWIKVFWFQFDVFEGASGEVTAQIEKRLAYRRAVVTEVQKPIPLGNGWERVTMSAQLIPQPDDEGIDVTFLETLSGTVAIDNLFVNSKCVKPGPDDTGDALGDVRGRVNLTQALAGAECQGVGVTEIPLPGAATQYWVSVRAALPGAQHALLRVSTTSPNPILGTTLLGASLATAPLGPGDLAVQTVANGTTILQQIVWVVLDRRPALPVLLQGVDAASGVVSSLTLPGFPLVGAMPNQPFGLAYDPSGELGSGSFWISGTTAGGQGALLEFSATTGALVDTRPFEPHCTGLGYDDTLGYFYGFSRAVQPTPTTPIQAHGFELSGYDFQRTGVRFCGDLLLANPGGPRGGFARGFEVWRDHSLPTAALDMVGIVETPNNPLGQLWLYEIAGPYRYGWSLLGNCGMRDTGPFQGIPFLGNTLEVTLTGVPHSTQAVMFLGFSNTTSIYGALPLPLQPLLGWEESVLVTSADVNTGVLTPSAPGEFVFPVPIPVVPTLAYAPLYFQWLAVDSGVTGLYAMTQGGKTVIYP
jgi:hypothetical protein